MRKQFKQKAIGLLALACVASSVFAVATYSVSAEDTCALTMRDGAAVRVGNTVAGTGIRFSANIDESIYTVTDTENHVAEFKDDVTEVGMIIVPAAALKNVGEADVFSYLQNTYSATKAEISTQFSSVQIQWDEKGYYVAGAIVSIQDSNLGLEYQAIPYTYDGTNYTYGTASDKRTISYVFNQALVDTDAEALAKKPDVLAKAIEMNAKLDITTELSVADGGDLSAFTAEGYVIDSVTLGGTPVTVADNVIEENTLDKTAAKKDAQTLAITYVGEEDEQKTLNVNAQVWSLYIDEPAELTDGSMNRASYSVGNAVYGYYKVTEDLNMTGAGNVCQGNSTPMVDTEQRFSYAEGFQGVFDGNGHTVSNLNLQYRSLFGSIGKDAIFRNVNFANVTYYATKNTYYTHTAILASYANGGTIENVTVTYTISDNFNTVGSAPTHCGVFFGQTYLTGGSWSKINLKDVTVTALNAESATNTSFAVLGVINSSNHASWDTYFNATNVSITGAGIYGDLKDNSICTTGWEGLTFKTGKPVTLTAIDTEIGQTINFADYVQGKEIQSVTYNGESVGTSVTFSDKTQASATPRNYIVTTTDGEKMIVPVTVWSLLLDENTDFARLSENVYVEKVYYTDGVNWSNAYYGYYKVTKDITMVGGTTDRIAAPLASSNGTTFYNATTTGDKCYLGTNWGFQGVFDGGGHTIDGMDVYHYSLFGVVGKNAVIRNVNFTNVEYLDSVNTAGYRSLFASWMLGGTIENVTVTYNVPNVLKTTGWNGVLFSDCYTYGNSGIYGSQITLTNVTVTALNTTTTEYAAFGNVRQYDSNAFNATNVKINNCPSYYNAKTAAMVYSETGITYGTVAVN